MKPHRLGPVRLATLTFVLIILGAISGCSSLSVSTDHDPEADFSSYKTYNWAPQDEANPQSILDAAINRSIEAEMASKGFTKADEPDLVIVTQASVNEVVTGATIDHWNTGGWGWYGGWGGGMGTSTVNYNSYNKGTLILDMVDLNRNQLVWRGVAEKSVSDNARVEQEKIDAIIQKLLADFPPS